MSTEGTRYRRICEALFSRYESTAAAEQRELMELVTPRAAARARGESGGYRYKHSPTAARAHKTLKSAHGTYLTPSTQRWFALKSRKRKKEGGHERENRWYSKVTELIYDSLAESNFYAQVDEVYSDRCGPGTGAMFIGGDEVTPLYFIHIPAGTFAIADDGKGVVNTLVRRFKYTPEQAAGEWGADALPPKAQAAFKDESKRYTEEFKFLHLVLPNPTGKKKATHLIAEERAYEGVYLAEDDGYAVVKKEGYYEFPFLVTRFLMGASAPYGEAPGLEVLPVIRQLMRLERLMDVLGEVAAYPRILQLAGQAGQIDVRAGAVSFVSREDAQLGYPREWATSGRYDIGEARIERKQQQVREAFFNDMLTAVSSVEKQMTAAEVAQRVAEKVFAFSAAFTQFTTDNIALFRRVLGILARRGELPLKDAPEDLVTLDEKTSSVASMATPNVVYQGKIAQAIEIVMSQGADRLVEKLTAYFSATGDTRVLDFIQVGELVRLWAETSGAPMELILDGQEAEALQARRAAEQQAQAQMQAEQQGMEIAQRGAQTIQAMRGGR